MGSPTNLLDVACVVALCITAIYITLLVLEAFA